MLTIDIATLLQDIFIRRKVACKYNPGTFNTFIEINSACKMDDIKYLRWILRCYNFKNYSAIQPMFDECIIRGNGRVAIELHSRYPKLKITEHTLRDAIKNNHLYIAKYISQYTVWKTKCSLVKCNPRMLDWIYATYPNMLVGIDYVSEAIEHGNISQVIWFCMRYNFSDDMVKKFKRTNNARILNWLNRRYIQMEKIE